MTTATPIDLDAAFRPLDDAERERTRRTKSDDGDTWTPVHPVPDDAPAATFAHRDLGTPSFGWCYRDAAGRVLGHVARFDVVQSDGTTKKTLRPRTYCEDANGNQRWCWKGFEKPLPLYGLDDLAQQTEAVALVVEGEKTADAARAQLSGLVVVSPMHGAESPQHADWTPLAGRHVVVWPDADEPGAKFAERVVRLVLEAGAASARVVSLPPDLPEGWDLADELPAQFADSAAIRAAIDAAKSLEDEGEPAPALDPADAVRFPFRLTADALEWCDETESGERRWLRVCQRLDVLALGRNERFDEWGRLLRWVDADGHEHEWAMPAELLAADRASEWLRELARGGFEVPFGSKMRSHLHEYLTTTRPEARLRVVPRIGWHAGAFVLPDETIGETQRETVRLQTAGHFEHAFRPKGTLDEWRERVARPCEGSPLLVLALAGAFAAPLLEVIGAESGGFHFAGASSRGKTTTLRVAGSVWGGGSSGFVRQWRATANGLEAVALGHSDALLCLDEMGQLAAREAGEVAYMLANGAGKVRARRDGASSRPVATWRVLFLSSGEVTLADRVQESGQRSRAGQAVRVVDLVIPEAGMVETLHEFPTSAALVEHLRRAVGECYGTAAPAFLERLSADREKAARVVREFVHDFSEQTVPEGADAQVRRVAERFGLVAAGGELAIEWGVLPWQTGAALDAARTCFAAWIGSRGGVGSAEVAGGIERVRAWLAANESRLDPWPRPGAEPERSMTRDRAGFARVHDGRREALLFASTFRRELAAGCDLGALARALAAAGLLVLGPAGRPADAVKVPGYGRMRLYRLMLDADDELASEAPRA